MMPTPVLRLVEDDVPARVLPGWAKISVGGELGEQMVIAISYQSDNPTLELLGDGAVVAVMLNGQEIPDGRFLIDELSDEEVIEEDVVERNGNSTLFGLNYAIVFPESGPVDGVNTSTPGWGFANQTPGQALRELLEAAQARGWWTDLEWDFTDGVDSSGAAWDPSIDEFYDQGTTLLDIVTRWKTRKLAVARMAGAELQLFQYDTAGTDRTLDMHLFRDADLTEGPVNRSSRNTVSVILGVTDGQSTDEVPGGFGVTRTDAPALTKYGHREGFVSQSQISDSTVLTSIVDGTLSLKARQREAFTYGLTCSVAGKLPFVDFDRGDTVAMRVRGETDARPMRCRQLTVEWNQNGEASGSAAFGDRKMDIAEQLAQRLEQLTNGSVDGGAYGQPIIGAPDQTPTGDGGGDEPPDTMPPAEPTALGATTAPVFNQGYLSATATLDWTAPTENADGSDLNDLGSYEVQYRNAGFPLWVAAGRYDKDTTQAVVLRLTVDADYEWRVRAFDIWGNASDWVEDSFTADNDIVAPSEQPSAPVVSAFLFSGLLVTWDGKAQGGTAIDNDIRHVEVHVSTSSGFVPGPGTLKDLIDIGGGSTVIGELTPGTTYYVRFKSVDWAGNPGIVSNQTTGVPDSVHTGDIADGAVTDGKMTSLTVTKLTAGTLSAVVTLSGEFRTAASGQRVVVNASGIKLYDAAANVVVNLDATTGTGTFNGVLGAMSLTGYIQVTNGTSTIIIQNFSGTPAIALSTGRLIEKYPTYMFTTVNAALRTLALRINSPGTNYVGGDTSSYDYTQITMVTIPYDGDFANATTLPTRVTGYIQFRLPYGLLSNINRPPNMSWASNYSANPDSTHSHLFPALIMRDGANPQHEVALRVDPYGAGNTADLCQVAVVTTSGGVGGSAYGRLYSLLGAPSGRALKEEIGEIPYSALDVIRDNPSMRWKYIKGDGTFELGPMADDLPPEVADYHVQQGEYGVRPNSMIGLLWKAIEELQEKIDRMEAA